MNSYDFRCKYIEEEIRSVWPGWHVAGRLGGGSFGDVFQIYRDNYGIRVDSALKVIQVDDHTIMATQPLGSRDGSQSDIPEALRGEIQIMEALRGAPNIVIIEDFAFRRAGQTSILFVRMELLKSLQEVLPGRNGHGTLSSIGEIIKLGKDVCRALMYCEKRGIIHRDIKPANLFVDRFGDYKVGDFGASKRMETVHVAQTMTGIGTISYMAPEIFRGKSYNNTVDIYALGLVLYQLLNNGRMPFLPESGSYTTQDIDSANYQRLHGMPVPKLVGKYVGSEPIDRRLDAVVRKACAAYPGDRYQTAKEFYEALVRAEMPEKEVVPELEKKSPEGPAVTTPIQNRKQEREHSWQEAGATATVLQGESQPYKSSQSQPESAGMRLGRSKFVIVLALVCILAVVALGLAVLQGRSESSELSTGTDPVVAAQSEGGGSEQESGTDTEESDNRMITDSWEEIIAAGEDGTYRTKYRIGDTKELDLGEFGVIEMELVAYDADELADGSGKAHMTWIAKNLLDKERMIGDARDCQGGWPDTHMRAWLKDSVLPMFPDAVRLNIRAVKKYSYASYYSKTVSSSDKIWLPSRKEVFGVNDSKETDGPTYLRAFQNETSRIKLQNGEASSWWLRSTYDNSWAFFDYVNSNGNAENEIPDQAFGVVVGFCL